jgi:hypothetical protein
MGISWHQEMSPTYFYPDGVADGTQPQRRSYAQG